MDSLQGRQLEVSSAKARAVEDARQMQASVIDAARRTSTNPPKYVLIELIGKGSYGCVYKGLVFYSNHVEVYNMLNPPQERHDHSRYCCCENH